MRQRRPSSSKLRVLRGGGAREGAVDDRAFQAYLRALAKDPDAIVAWALAYEAAGDAERDAWIHLLETEAAVLPVAREAVVGPLLAVEDGPRRRARLGELVREAVAAAPSLLRRAARLDVPETGARSYALLLPLWLHFAELLVVSLDGDGRVAGASRDPVVDARDGGAVLVAALGPEGREVDAADAVDDLAHAVLATRRGGRPLPEALARAARLFDVESTGDDGDDGRTPRVAGGGGWRGPAPRLAR